MLIKRIIREFPRLRVSSARRITTGWDNVVLDVEGRFIFRFPRFKAAENSLKREVKLLGLLRGRLPSAIPYYRYVSLNKEKDEFGFAGYEKIPGFPVTIRGYRSSWTEELADGLAEFLRRLHSSRITPTISRVVPRDAPGDSGKSLESHHLELMARGYRYLDSTTRKMAEKFFEAGIRTLDRTSHRPSLIHGDLTSRNILVGSRNGRLKGVLDWGDSRIGDPALDFAGLFEVNRNLGIETARRYGDYSTRFLERVEVYWRMLPFFEILYGIYSDSERISKMGARNVRRRLHESFH